MPRPLFRVLGRPAARCLRFSACQTMPIVAPRRFLSAEGASGRKKGWTGQGSREGGEENRPRGENAGAASGAHKLSTRFNSGTVDEAEVDKFGAIGAVGSTVVLPLAAQSFDAASEPSDGSGRVRSQGWWDLDGMQKPLHSFNALRIPFL